MLAVYGAASFRVGFRFAQFLRLCRRYREKCDANDEHYFHEAKIAMKGLQKLLDGVSKKSLILKRIEMRLFL